MRYKNSLTILIALIAMSIYGLSVISLSSSDKFSIAVGLSKPRRVIFPCEVSIVGDIGEKGLRIPPKAGRGWRGEAGGEAMYKFYVPQDGKYTIWANCLWFDVCANAVFVQIDGMDKTILGNDPVYKEWHWVRGFDIKLKKGTHTLTLSNHSDHISMLEVQFINNPSQSPDNSGVVFSDIFYDGFDGCDRGNFESWKNICGSWAVLDPTNQACAVNNVLVGDCNDKNMIVYPDSDWQDYYLDISVKSHEITSDNSAIGICFGLKDEKNYYTLKISPKLDRKSFASILKVSDSQKQLSDKFEFDWKTDSYNHIQIKSEVNKISVKINTHPLYQQETKEPVIGGIGLMLEPEITVYFDDIHVRKILEKN